ncbi:MAG: hypothetical protein KIH10_18000 [Candidatus Freyarchaeota archaeon]|nr:hypothetical protein [Candidatus Jordarchaeia archaeon]
MIVVILAFIVGGGILGWRCWKTREVLPIKFPKIETQREVKEEITQLNIPGRWFFPGGEAPPGYLVFREDGILEIPEWIGGEARQTSLRWQYDQDKELLIINFKLASDLFPENERMAQDYFGNVEEGSWIGSFSGYNRQDRNITIKVTHQTTALEFFGWLFYKSFPPP